MTLQRVLDPAEIPLTLAEAKTHLRITWDDQDEEVAAFIAAATRHVEHYTGRALISQGWEKRLDAFPLRSTAIELARPPVTAADAVRYLDPESGALLTLDPQCYELDAQTETAWLVPAYGFVWPLARAHINAVRIEFTCGYLAPGVVPEDIKQALKLLVGHFSENREAVVVGNIVSELPLAVTMLLDPYRVLRFA